MTTDMPKAAPNGRYSIKQAAELLGVHRNTITRYVNIGRLRSYHRVNGMPFVRGVDIIRLWQQAY